MPRAAVGTVFCSSTGMLSIQVSVGEKQRRAESVPWAKSKPAAKKRAALVSAWVQRLRKCGHIEFVEDVVKDGAAATTQEELAKIEEAIKHLERRPQPLPAPKPKCDGSPTFKEFAERWLDGKLHETWPDHVRPLKDRDNPRSMLRSHVSEAVGNVPMREFTLEHADAIMSGLPPKLAQSMRAKIGRFVQRVVNLAVYPGKLLSVNPIPRGWVPKNGPRKALAFLYPSEDAALMAHTETPLGDRVLYGFLAREGLRPDEAERLVWGDLDLKRGVITLDNNKTKDPRVWKLDPGVVRALTKWQKRTPSEPSNPVFPQMAHRQATLFRAALQAAGVDRSELFKSTAARRPIRLHDTRATFCTLALGAGRSERWVRDRTGHGAGMLDKYVRAARTAEELHMGWLADLDSAIPEFREGQADGSGETQNETQTGQGSDPTSSRKRGKKSKLGAPRNSLCRTSDPVPPCSEQPQDRCGTNHAQSENGQPGEPICKRNANGLDDSADPEGAEVDPRVVLIRSLSDSIARLAAVGDLGAARVASKALAALLEEKPGSPAPVIDLGSRRGKD